MALASGKRRRVDSELHRDGRFVDGDVRQRRGILNRGDGLADSNAFDSGDGDDVADFGLRVYLAIDASPEDVVRDARRVCTVDGFRTRSPDLVEVFRALTAETRSS